MLTAKILDFFNISSGKVFIVDFSDELYSPSQGGTFINKGSCYNIKPYGISKHDYIDNGKVYNKQVWSCQFESDKTIENNIDLNPGDIMVLKTDCNTIFAIS